MIEFSDVRSGYGKREVLHGVSFSVEKGEILSLIGPNGCGKTTLLRAACGFLPLTSGEVRFDGKPLKEYGRKEFARMAAFLPQARDVPAISVERLVSHGRYPHLSFGRDLTEKDREAVSHALEETGMTALAKKELGELSGGERQRAYLALTLAQETEILFLDEPTTYLDVKQKFEVMELIRRVRDLGKTVVMVLHDLSLAFSYSDRVAVMEEGNLQAEGGAEEVFDGGVPARVFGVSCRRVELDGETEFLFSKKKA